MAADRPLYDLVLCCDTQTDQERRDAIVENVSAVIEQAGELVSRHDWGVRATAFEVRKRTDADYHLLQFHGSVELLEQLDHSLNITDGVLRFPHHQAAPGHPASARPHAGDRRHARERRERASPRTRAHRALALAHALRRLRVASAEETPNLRRGRGRLPTPDLDSAIRASRGQ
jgi:small subunit ribosomal protein S6